MDRPPSCELTSNAGHQVVLVVMEAKIGHDPIELWHLRLINKITCCQ